MKYKSEFQIESSPNMLGYLSEHVLSSFHITKVSNFAFEDKGGNIDLQLFGLAVSEDWCVVLEFVEALTIPFLERFKEVVKLFKEVNTTERGKAVIGVVLYKDAAASSLVYAVRNHLRCSLSLDLPDGCYRRR